MKTQANNADSKNMLDDLVMSDKKFQAIINNSSDLILIVDLEGTLKFISSTIKSAGYSADELLGMNIFDLIHPDDREQAWSVFQQGISTPGVTHITETRLRARNGDYLYFESIGDIIYEKGSASGVIINSRNITDRQSARKQLEVSEKKFRTIIENSSDIITIVDVGGTIRFTSPGYTLMLGYDKNELIGVNGFDLIHEDDREHVKRILQMALKNPGTIQVAEHRFRNKKGDYVYLETKGNMLYENGEVSSLVLMSRDVTDRKISLEKLEASEKRFRAIVESTSDIIWIADLEANLVFASPSVTRWLGYTPEELIGKNILSVIHPDDKEKGLEMIQRGMESPGVVHMMEHRLPSKDGTYVYFETKGNLLYENGKLTHVLYTSRNITERRIAQDKREEYNRMLEEKVKERTAELLVEKNKSDSLLNNILPEEVANELKSFGKSYARKHADVTVLFADIHGFTAIAEKLSPELLVNELDECFRAFDLIVEKYGLEKIKTIGDAYMAASGLPVADPDHALNAVRTAFDMQRFMQGFKISKQVQNLPVFEIRIGIHSGPVIAGVVGAKKFAYDIWGDTVNLASRMENSGEAGKINISGATYALVKDHFSCEYRGKMQAKNKGEVDMYFVS